MELLAADNELVLFNQPLDSDDLNAGIPQENGTTKTFPTYYTSIPANKQLTDIKYEITDQLYAPENMDPVLDYTSLYLSGNLEETPVEVSADENLAGETYVELPPYKLEGYTIKELQDMDIAMASARMRFRIRIRLPKPTYPNGRVLVKDDVKGNIPVPGVQVQVIHFGRILQGETNGNGNYRINTGFWVGTHVSVLFNNRTALLKPLDTSGTWARTTLSAINALVTGCVHMEGFKGKSALNNQTILFQHNNQARLWALMKVAVTEYYRLAVQNGIGLPPGKLTIYAHWKNDSGYGSASAPLLNWILSFPEFTKFAEDRFADLDYVINTDLITAMGRVLPDITMPYCSKYSINSRYIIHTMFHELAHASHMAAAGGQFWRPYVTYIVLNDGYGTEQSSGHEMAALSESWAEYVGDLFSNQYHGSYSYFDVNISRTLTNNLELADNDEDEEWIPYGVYHDMTDNTGSNEPTKIIRGLSTTVLDNIVGYTAAQYYQTLKDAVETPGDFRTKFIQRYGSGQATQINTLFSTYGY